MPKAKEIEVAAQAATPEGAAAKRRGRPTREEKQAKIEREGQSDFLVGCTLIERAYCVGLVRLLRDDYWMAEFVRQILDKESKSKWQWTIKNANALLDNFDTVETLAGNAQNLGQNWSNHPILRAIRKEWEDDEIVDYLSDKRVRGLIESAQGK